LADIGRARLVSQVVLVEDLDPGLGAAQFLELVVGAGGGQAGVEHLDDHIDPLDQFAYLLQGLSHVSGIPSDGHSLVFFS
jgi:hypothetical protein